MFTSLSRLRLPDLFPLLPLSPTEAHSLPFLPRARALLTLLPYPDALPDISVLTRRLDHAASSTVLAECIGNVLTGVAVLVPMAHGEGLCEWKGLGNDLDEGAEV